ncbi:hypothetical protein GCM10023321_80470 [Pseudonocardia eucalypti]|uniref:DNA primase n=1 Tax=Pseudonocardia eucalypti TaxID=648755 RepID=A0ABP9RDM8_9PSEU|nr:hypothetical protein [Pseudonocardia eucalypti]
MPENFSSTAELANHLARQGFGPAEPDPAPTLPEPVPVGPELERLP